MTMQPRDEAALALYQANKRHPEIETLLDQFFGFTTKAEFERQLRCVEQEFPCVISTSDFSSQLSGAL